MYRVSSRHLEADGRRAQAADGSLDRGQMTGAQLAELLAAFAAVDPADNDRFDPCLVVIGPAAKLTVRMAGGRLQVHDGRDHFAPAHEMTVAELRGCLDGRPGIAPAGQAARRGLALGALALGVALIGYSLYSAFQVQSVDRRPEVKPLAEAGEVKRRAAALAGTYATGARTGDRVIEVGGDGLIRFYELGARGPINDATDTYRLRRHDTTLCLVTPENGVVDLEGESLVYYRDTYLRRRPSW